MTTPSSLPWSWPRAARAGSADPSSCSTTAARRCWTPRSAPPARPEWTRWSLALGGAADEVRERVDLDGVDVVLNPDFGDGCSTSIRSALGAVRDDALGVVLMLGDQPGVAPGSVAALVAQASDHAVGVCEYDDGLGHPLWFHRRMFDVLTGLHGDKAVWKLVDAGDDVARVRVAGDVPRDVDTWEDYQALLEAAP